MNTKKVIGDAGEDAAANYLKKAGYRIIDRNYRTRLGEIDLIARRKEFVVFVEVKMRKSDAFAQAREFVTYSKQQRIIAAARSWLVEHDKDEKYQPRFDVIEVYGTPEQIREINHIENAFEV